jgi:ParB/RepB/Spo0J family partition protein
MSAIPASTTGHHQFIPLKKLAPSPLNHRKHFDKAKMEELAESVRAQGVICPILARPLNDSDSFEVVAGERRFRAAKMADLVDIPAIVRELTDAQALELQVIENGQRVDVHPLEEAEGYEALLQCKRADGTAYSVDEIAAKVGKGKGYIYGRLKLTALCPEGRKAFYAGELDFSKALLIARIAHHDTQRQALKDLTEHYRGEEPMSYRAAHQHVLQTYMLALKSAPFDIADAALLPKAGACGPCPKRTGNQADLFGDVKSADVCTDPKCFDDKRQAHYAVAAKELEAKGKKVLYGAAAKKAFPDWDSPHSYQRDHLQGGYVKFDETTYASGRSRKVSELLGEDYEPIHVQHPGTGQILKVATQQAVAAAAAKLEKQKGGKATKKRNAGPAKPDPAEILRKRLVAHVFAAFPKKLGEDELRWLATSMLVGDVDFELIEEFLLPPAKGAKTSYGFAQKRLQQALPKLDVEGLSRLILAMYITDDYDFDQDERLRQVAKQYGVDLKAVEKKLEAETKTAAETKAPDQPKKKAKK